MTIAEFLEIIRNGEDSSVEFKRDDVTNYDLAKELVAFLNLDGGIVLLGVEDDGTISGTTRPNLEEWVADLCRSKIAPPIIPHLSWVRNVEPNKNVLAVRVSLGTDKPYARVHNDRRTYYIRVGSTNREASREELERMFQTAGRVNYGLKPIVGTSLDDLDIRRLTDYLTCVLEGEAPDPADKASWEDLLCRIDFMTRSAEQAVSTVDGILLFGKNPKRLLPQSGLRAICYGGTEPDYATRADEELKGSLLPLFATNRTITESGLVEQAIDFVRRNTQPSATIEKGRRIDATTYPEEVIREVFVNALVHRDYTITGTDITLTIYADRLEVRSPGRLPNTVTIEGMKSGLRYARNQTLVNVMRDYRYVDFRGMGIRNKIIPGMNAHNGTQPELIAEENSFTIRLWQKARTQ